MDGRQSAQPAAAAAAGHLDLAGEQKQVIVTGGSRGIGRAVVEAFSKRGHRVLFTYNSSSAAHIEAMCAELPPQTTAMRLDQGSFESIQAFAAAVDKWRGAKPLDVLVNNAGLGSATVEHYAGLNQAMMGEFQGACGSAAAGPGQDAAPGQEQSEEATAAREAKDGAMLLRKRAMYDEALMRVNALGPVWVTEALLPMFDNAGRAAAQLRGSVLFIGSVGGGSQSVFPAFRMADGMSKAALVYAVKCLAAKHVHTWIDFNCVCPGATNTGMFRESTLDRMAEPDVFVNALPKKRLIQPAEIAEAISYICLHPAARIFHGAIIDASQGLAVRPGLLTEFDL